MSETIKTFHGNGFTVALEARDQYNDYSVAFDYTVRASMRDGRSTSYGVGSRREFALKAFNVAVAAMCADHPHPALRGRA